MAAKPLLASPEDLATQLDVELSDANLQLAIRRASNRFRGETQNPVHLVEGDVAELNGNGTNRLLLPAAPVVGDVVVRIDGVDVSDRVRVDRKAGILKLRGGVFPDDYGNVEVTYSHGYPVDDIPGDIEDVVLEHAATLAMVLAHIAQEGAGGVQATYGAAATVGRTQKWADTVARYSLKDRL